MSTNHASRGWIVDDSTFAARLALVRLHAKWTNVKAAAKACGIPAATWRAWERLDGSRPHDYEAKCRQISNASGCDLDWLMRGTSSTNGSAKQKGRSYSTTTSVSATELMQYQSRRAA